MGQFDFIRMALTPKFRPPGEALSAMLTGEEPEQGKVSIGGTGGGVIDLNLSESHTMNRQHNKEQKRTYDHVRIFNTQSDGTIDRDSYIDAEIMHQVKFSDGSKASYAKPEIKENMEMEEENVTRVPQNGTRIYSP